MMKKNEKHSEFEFIFFCIVYLCAIKKQEQKVIFLFLCTRSIHFVFFYDKVTSENSGAFSIQITFFYLYKYMESTALLSLVHF